MPNFHPWHVLMPSYRTLETPILYVDTGNFFFPTPFSSRRLTKTFWFSSNKGHHLLIFMLFPTVISKARPNRLSMTEKNLHLVLIPTHTTYPFRTFVPPLFVTKPTALLSARPILPLSFLPCWRKMKPVTTVGPYWGPWKEGRPALTRTKAKNLIKPVFSTSSEISW